MDIHGTPQGGDRLVGDSIAGYIMEESSNDPAAGQGGEVLEGDGVWEVPSVVKRSHWEPGLQVRSS